MIARNSPLNGVVHLAISWNAGAYMSVKVKICGITKAQDGIVASEAGADILGFVFFQSSPRFVPIEVATGIIQQLPPFIVKAGVFVDAPTDLVLRAIGDCGLDLLQFHGNETPEYCSQFGLMSMKAFRIRNAGSLQHLTDYGTEAWLLDAYAPDKVGGTGATFDWALALEAQRLGRPIFLAGGLTPDNVAEAVRRVQPYGVDVSSGVEKTPGKKDHAKVRAFIQAAKGAES
jgi:phosphoribosylanthranilate isomerase